MGQGPNKFSSLEEMEDAVTTAEASEMPPSAPIVEEKPAEEACDGTCCGCTCKDGE